ncbi:hypothetical protein BJ912DRAFT_919173 [Pholiota molesta]|nr:hypothetical protein BJ912DRAFT_919173 [Pholiota molesta]
MPATRSAGVEGVWVLLLACLGGDGVFLLSVFLAGSIRKRPSDLAMPHLSSGVTTTTIPLRPSQPEAVIDDTLSLALISTCSENWVRRQTPPTQLEHNQATVTRAWAFPGLLSKRATAIRGLLSTHRRCGAEKMVSRATFSVA